MNESSNRHSSAEMPKQREASSVNTISQRSIGSYFAIIIFFTVALLMTATLSRALADDSDVRTIHLLRPLDGATVREIVPIRISSANLPSDGYVTVSIDKVFRSARVIDPGSSLLYSWDTQAPYQDPNQPGVDMFTADGDHEIEVAVYNRQGQLQANGTSNIKLANTVSNLPDGITLAYNWSESETLRYKRHSELNQLSTGSDVNAQNVESSDIRFARSIEDANGGEYLVRDQVYAGGKIVTHGAANNVENVFNLKSRYRTVNKYGETLSEESPFSTGDHIGFSIIQVPSRRITVGASWDTKLEVSVPWATEKPTVLQGSARLDSFEWQDGYPTAKVIETYDGPGELYADVKGTIKFDADNIHLIRTYWFAYNSKRLVKSRTEMTIDGNVDSNVASAITSGSAGSSSGPGASAPSIQNPFGGDDGSGDNQTTPGMNSGATASVPIKLQVIDVVTLVGV